MKISKNTIENLQLFRMQALKLKSNPDFFKNLEYEFRGKEETWGTSFKTNRNFPDDKTVKSFLMDIRPFILQNEPIHFNRACNSILKEINGGELMNKINNARIVWNKLVDIKKNYRDKGIVIKVGDKEMNPAEQLNLWFNAEFFHLDKNKRELFKQMQVPPFVDMSYLGFLSLIQELAQLVIYFDEKIISEILKCNKN